MPRRSGRVPHSSASVLGRTRESQMWLFRLAPKPRPRWVPRPIALPADRYREALSALEQMIGAFDSLERDLADGRPLEELARSWVSPSLITVWARAVGAAS